MEKPKRDAWIPSEDATRTALMLLIIVALIATGDAIVDFGTFIISLMIENPEISEQVFEVVFVGTISLSIFIVWKGRWYFLDDEK